MRDFSLRNSVHPASCLISPSTRSPGQPASLMVASAKVSGFPQETSRGLGRESKLVGVCVCLFDPVINEANESSSACHLGQDHLVETGTPPP